MGHGMEVVGLPGSGEVGAGFGVVAETGVDAVAYLDEATEEPDEIGEAVEVGDGLGWDEVAGLGEADGAALGPAADGAGEVKSRRQFRPAGKNEISQGRQLRYRRINLHLQPGEP